MDEEESSPYNLPVCVTVGIIPAQFQRYSLEFPLNDSLGLDLPQSGSNGYFQTFSVYFLV